MSLNEIISITGIGMHSPMLGATTACAAARAGLSRPSPLPVLFAEPDEVLPIPLSGFESPGLKGFSGVGRLTTMALYALQDLVTNFPPNRNEKYKYLIFLPDPCARPRLEQQESAFSNDFASIFKDGLLRYINNDSILQESFLSITVMTGEEAEFSSVVDQACVELRQHPGCCCIVGAVDSLIEKETVEYYLSQRRLYTPENVTGFIPGEGAAMLKMEMHATHSISNIVSMEYGVEPSIDVSDDDVDIEKSVPPLTGDIYSKIIRKAFVSANIGPDNWYVGLIYNGLNGEATKAAEWGNCMVKLKHKYQCIDRAHWASPVDSFGALGCATMVFSVCLATSAFERNYAMGNDIVVCAASNSGGRCAVILRST